MGLLAPPEDRHPVGGFLADLEAVEHLTHGVGEWPAPGHDDESAAPRRLPDRGRHAVEHASAAEHPPADLHDGVDRSMLLPRRHGRAACGARWASRRSATAAAGACRDAGPRRSARSVTRSPARRAAAAAMKAPSPVTTAHATPG